MILLAWLFIGIVALLVTAGAVVTSDNGVAIVAGALGFLSWGVFAFAALDVQTVSGGSELSYSFPAVTILAVAFALVPGYIALTGPVELVNRARDGDPRDV